MKINQTARISGLMVLAFAGLGEAVSAVTLSYSTGFGSAGSPLAPNAFPAELSLTKFDAALGTLMGIELTLDSTAVITPFVANGSTTPASVYNVFGTFSMSLYSPDGAVTNFDLEAGPFGESFNQIPVPANTAHQDVGTATKSGSTVTAVAAEDYGAYQDFGLHTFSVYVDTAHSTTGSGGGNDVSFGVNGYIYGTATVTYDYTPVPEPSAWGLLAGLGLLAFGACRRFGKV